MKTRLTGVAIGLAALGLSAWAASAPQRPKSYSPAATPDFEIISGNIGSEAVPMRSKGYSEPFVPLDGKSQAAPGSRSYDAPKPKSYSPPFVRSEAAPLTVDKVLAGWFDAAAKAARAVIAKYGQPDEISRNALVWRSKGPWKRIIAHGELVEHNFPSRHFDTIEQVVDYKVPEQKLAELRRFGGHLIVYRAAGELASLCDSEESNFLTMNLADEIMTETKTADQARSMLVYVMELTSAGKTSSYAQRLLFVP